MFNLNLNTVWFVRQEPLYAGIEFHKQILARTDGWMQADLPCDIHVPLIDNGLIEEPLVANHSLDSEWVENRSWWFKKIFTLTPEQLDQDVIELTLDSLDAMADVFLNGEHLGSHRSAFYPFQQDVKPLMKLGENSLLVRLTSGLEHFNADEVAPFHNSVSTRLNNRGDARRVFVRKPQYVYGWDWGPRVATCGIMQGARLIGYQQSAIRSVHITTQSITRSDGWPELSRAQVAIAVEIEQFHPFESREGKVYVRLRDSSRIVWEGTQSVTLCSGINYVDFAAGLEDIRLWWPSGAGAQPLYQVTAEVVTEDGFATYPELNIGIRTVRVDQEKQGEGDRLFAVEVNGVRIFCKGGNWIPADSIYSRVTDEKYGTLIREAQEANFNMLRIWGGGIYETDVFYQLCNKHGILIWHDFMFACALYPDQIEWFQIEAEKEIDYQTRRLRNHPSIAIWCGNNENHWGFDEWWIGERKALFLGGAVIYNHIAPRIVRRNCPNIPYWNSSPYGGEHPNGNRIGDRHHWYDCTMNPDMEKRITPEEYDKIESKFISEYGYIGPCRKSTINRYHGNEPIDRNSSVWHNHNNTFEKQTVPAGITKHYMDAGDLDLDQYLLYAGLTQGLMLGYSLEAIRYKGFCHGALFWMYNDCWGEVGWTIIDYYLKRKTSYYYVKRAFAPVKLIARRDGDLVVVVGINDTPKSAEFNAEYGYVTFDGAVHDTEQTRLSLPPFSRTAVLEFSADSFDLRRGVAFIKPDTAEIPVAYVRSGTFRDLAVLGTRLEISDFHREGADVRFRVSTSGYAHGVHFNLDDSLRLEDEYFDLLPGESREMIVFDAVGLLHEYDIKPVCVNQE